MKQTNRDEEASRLVDLSESDSNTDLKYIPKDSHETDFGTDSKSKQKIGVQLDWKDVDVTGLQKKVPVQILHKLTGCARPGELMAIMGSSGAGKSTLMNILTRRNMSGLTITGKVEVNGVPMADDISNISAYIQQNDVFVGALTVLEHLQFHARLKLSKLHRNDQKERIEEVIKIMGLQKCVKTVIGTPGLSKTISGGEMKRLAIASEILVDPPIIFADEPTSGLDSYLASAVCQTLKDLARNGTTVLCTIHQPSSEIFDVFDSLLLLSMGKNIYHGPKNEARDFFNSIGNPCKENYNPADHYIFETSVLEGKETESKDKINHIWEEYNKSRWKIAIENSQIETKKVDPLVTDIVKEAKEGKANVLTSFTLLLWRALISQYREKSTAIMKLSQNIGTAIILGLVYLRIPWNANVNPYDKTDVFNINGAIFAVVCSISFAYLFLVVITFPRIKILLRREYYDGLYPLYIVFLNENVSGLPFLIIVSFLFLGIQYAMIGLFPSWICFCSMYLTSILVGLSATGYGYLISALAPTFEAANAIAPPLMVPLLLFGGFFLQSDSVPPWFLWLKYISWFYYGAENLYVAQWREGGYCLQMAQNTFGMMLKGFFIKEQETLMDADTCVPKDYSDCSCLNIDPEGGIPYVYVNGSVVLEAYGYKEENFWRNIGCLCALAVGFRVIAYWILVFKFRSANR